MKPQRISTRKIQRMKENMEAIPMVTAYDCITAKFADRAGIPIILVGDSLGMVALGYETTHPVTMEDMIRSTGAVVRGSTRALIVADLPFMSYRIDTSQAVMNAGRLVQEGGAQAVKLEGGKSVSIAIRRIVEGGIPVMGHIGLTPQALFTIGGYRVQGKTEEEGERIMEDAIAVQDAGAFAVVIELTSEEVAQKITAQLTIPTIGIGAGNETDGQVQVITDLLGMDPDFIPKHAVVYANLGERMEQSLRNYASDVTNRKFHGAYH